MRVEVLVLRSDQKNWEKIVSREKEEHFIMMEELIRGRHKIYNNIDLTTEF